jgi:hypothetical protein
MNSPRLLPWLAMPVRLGSIGPTSGLLGDKRAARERSKGRPGWAGGEVSAQGKNGKRFFFFFHTFLIDSQIHFKFKSNLDFE